MEKGFVDFLGNGTMEDGSLRIVSNRFAVFRTRNFDLTNEPRGRPESKVSNDELMVTLVSDPSQNAYKLSLKLGVGKYTLLTHLAHIETILPAAESSDFARHLVLVLPHHTFNHVQTSSTLATDD
ncbi:hypothetical protein TNCV_4773751 [Trichonephila clavipes]|nr:hypothetical protein TNCV_4773751 [Trichonephila clavipes]